MRKPRLDDPDLPLADLMRRYPGTIPVFLHHRMLCVGCLISPFHKIADASRAYELDEAAFMAELSEAAKS